MKRFAFVPLAVMLVAALAPVAALAKGASEATIAGPGVDGTVALKAGGLRSKLGKLAEATGFYPAVFARTPDPMLPEQPAGDLGPRYTITYVMPGSYGKEDRIFQDVYPYALPDPVTYLEPGQSFFGTEETRGGWFVATSSLEEQLVAAGLPQNPPTGDGGSEWPWTVIGAFVAFGLGLVLAALLIRRHGQRRTVTA